MVQMGHLPYFNFELGVSLEHLKCSSIRGYLSKLWHSTQYDGIWHGLPYTSFGTPQLRKPSSEGSNI